MIPLAPCREHFSAISVKSGVKQLLLLSLTCSFLGCTSTPTFYTQHQELQAQLQTVVIEDGIDSREANIIAQSYFLRFGPGCGVAAKITDGGSFWISNTYVGYAATPSRDPIRIDKQTGRVTWSDGPIIETPKFILMSEKDSLQPTR